MGSLLNLFRTAGFAPHISCISAGNVVLLHVIGDLLTAGAYFLIPLSLFIFTTKQSDRYLFNAITCSCGLFILFCGLSHVAGVVVLWHPYYVLEGWIKVFTGVMSWIALVQLVPVLRQLLVSDTRQMESLSVMQELKDLRALHARYHNRDVMKAFRLRALARDLDNYAKHMDVEISDDPSSAT